MRYWSQQAVALCDDIEDEGLEEVKIALEKAVCDMSRDCRISISSTIFLFYLKHR